MRLKASIEIRKFLNLPENLGKEIKIHNLLTQNPVDIDKGIKI